MARTHSKFFLSNFVCFFCLLILQIAPANSVDWESKCKSYAGDKWEPDFVGKGIKDKSIKPEIALDACKKAVNQNRNAANLFRLGRVLKKAHKNKLAYKLLKESSAKNYSSSQYLLGQMYMEGIGVKQKTQKALDWYKEAAMNGNALAQFKLGKIYLAGKCVRINTFKSLDFFKSAGKQGFVPAQTAAGFVYILLSGGSKKDEQKAYQWYSKAARNGDPNAQRNLGLMYMDGVFVRQNDARAVEWFQKAAKQNLADAQTNLGHMYRLGRGVEKNYLEAFQWFLKAANQGEKYAQRSLGYMYEHGQGVIKDQTKSEHWYQKANAQN